MICLKDVSVKYDEYVIKDFSLRIDRSEIIIICGKSGIGKSSLLSLISGCKEPSGGNITYDELDVKDRKKINRWRLKNVGYLDQEIRLINSLDVIDNIYLPIILKKNKVDAYQEEAYKLLNIFQIEKYKHCKPDSLSGGEKRRVEIIRTIISNPKYLIMDEPTNGLDELNVKKLCDVLQELKKEHSIVISTHDERIRKYLDGKVVNLDKKEETYI